MEEIDVEYAINEQLERILLTSKVPKILSSLALSDFHIGDVLPVITRVAIVDAPSLAHLTSLLAQTAQRSGIGMAHGVHPGAEGVGSGGEGMPAEPPSLPCPLTIDVSFLYAGNLHLCLETGVAVHWPVKAFASLPIQLGFSALKMRGKLRISMEIVYRRVSRTSTSSATAAAAAAPSGTASGSTDGEDESGPLLPHLTVSVSLLPGFTFDFILHSEIGSGVSLVNIPQLKALLHTALTLQLQNELIFPKRKLLHTTLFTEASMARIRRWSLAANSMHDANVAQIIMQHTAAEEKDENDGAAAAAQAAQQLHALSAHHEEEGGAEGVAAPPLPSSVPLSLFMPPQSQPGQTPALTLTPTAAVAAAYSAGTPLTPPPPASGSAYSAHYLLTPPPGGPGPGRGQHSHQQQQQAHSQASSAAGMPRSVSASALSARYVRTQQ
jgi:hypothetical protein